MAAQSVTELLEGNDGEPLIKVLQDFLKSSIAPYKYPRAVEFVSQLPKAQSKKIQQFLLRADGQRPEGSATEFL
jgi:2-aminobenzoate-CoA ligase